MTIKNVSDYLEKIAPLDQAEDFDNVGLLIGNEKDHTQRDKLVKIYLRNQIKKEKKTKRKKEKKKKRKK